MSAGYGPHRRRRRDGFTLVEVLVALAGFAAAVALLLGLFLTQQRSFAVQGDAAEAQRNLRRGIDLLERELHRAGYGLPSGASVMLPAVLTGDPPIFLVSGLGLSAGSGDRSDILCVAHSSLRPDRLARGMETASSPLRVEGAIPWRAGDLGMIADRSGSDLFRVSRVDGGEILHHAGAGSFDGRISRPYGEGARVAKVDLAGYAVSAPGGGSDRALVRRTVDPDGNLRSQAVVEGIGEMRVRLSVEGAVRVVLVARSRFGGEVPGSRSMEAVIGIRNRGDAP